MAHKFLRDTGEFAFPLLADLGTSTTSTRILSYVTSTTTATFSLSSTATTFDIAFVTQGTSGVWFATAFISATDTAGTNTTSFKLWDGTTVIGAGIVRALGVGVITSGSVSGVISNPAANIKLSVVCNSATGQIDAGGTGFSTYVPNSAVTAIRIG